ncbi:MAG: hypothetical protein JXA90_10970 [Planctomycetes bacterium]|nr:hypothetical protein [Planctomycetota bacterium]
MKQSKRSFVAAFTGIAALAGLALVGISLHGCSDGGGSSKPTGVDVTETSAAMVKSAIEGIDTVGTVTSIAGLGLGEFPDWMGDDSLKIGSGSKLLGKLGVNGLIARHLKGDATALAASESYDCSLGGSVTVSCDSTAEGSTLRLVAKNCTELLDEEDGVTMEMNGEIEVFTDDPEACEAGLGDATLIAMKFKSLSMTIRAEGSVAARISLSGEFAMTDGGPAGCDSRDGEIFANYKLEMSMPSEDIDMVVTAEDFTIEHTATAAPCTETFTLDGKLTLVDRAGDESLGQGFDNLVVAMISDEFDELITINGRATSSCVGTIEFETQTPVQVTDDDDCPVAGAINATVVDTGIVSSITFTPAGGVTLVYDVDGPAEETRELESCEDVDAQGSCK